MRISKKSLAQIFQGFLSDRDRLKRQLHDAIYRPRFYSNSLIHILSLSNSYNNVASVQKNRGDKSHRVIVPLRLLLTHRFLTFRCVWCVKIKGTDDVLPARDDPQFP